MKMILNRDYRVIFNGGQSLSFQMHVACATDWHTLQDRLAYKQRNWPERNYTLQIWDANKESWQDCTNLKSKYALFSED